MSDQHNEDLRRWIEDRDVGFEKPFLDNIIITSDSADKQLTRCPDGDTTCPACSPNDAESVGR